jgi:tetratricopeptide (TPR) repeat protein
MIVFLAMLIAGGIGAMIRVLGTTPGLAVLEGILGLGMLVALVTAIVLAILGLIEFSNQSDVYTQGKAQAIWTLVLAGVMCVIAGTGYVKGLQRATGFVTATGHSQPSKIFTFDDLNFRFLSPDRPWVSFDASAVNKDSKLSFMRRNPEAYFIIIAEKVGTQVSFTTEQLADLGKARLQAAAASSRVVSETPQQVRGLNGLLVETEAQVGAYQLHYRHWYCATNGYAYQLVSYSKSEDQQLVASELGIMLSHFELIDPNRVASFAIGFTTNFYSLRHSYAVILTNSAWHKFSNLEKSSPMAEFGVSQGDSCMVVVPTSLNGEKITDEALASAFLATDDIAYPNENLINVKTLTEGTLHGKQFDFSRDLNGKTFRYRFKIMQGNGEGYLIAAWTLRRASDAEPVLDDALARVRFLSSTNSSPLLPANGLDGKRESETQGFILNQAGLYSSNQGDYEQALPLFRAAAKANDEKSIYIINALNTWQHLDRPKEALAFLDEQPATALELPEVRANKAFFQAQASMLDQAVTNYASLFATGYRSDTHLTEYVGLLMEQKQYDAALAAVQTHLKSGDSIAAHLLQARVYGLMKDLPKAMSVLKDLRDKAPFNVQVATSLAETFILAGQYSEALEIAHELLKDNGNSAYYELLKGRSELGLKWYRESKLSFAEAIKLAPANKDIRSYLDYVSGLLGEGDNTAVMDPIDPVVLPATLTNIPAETVPAEYAKNYGAYYVHRIVAVTYEPGKACKTTEFTLTRILDTSGVSAFSSVQVVFDPLSEQVFVNEVRVKDADGKTISTGNPANYYVLDDHSSPSASQMKVLNIPIPGLQPGCQLVVTITRKQQGHLDEFPFCAHLFACAVPVKESVFFLGCDAKHLKYHTSPAIEPQKLPEGLCWRVFSPMLARVEPLQPPAMDFLPMLWISDASAQWPVIVSNYLASISDRLESDPALQSRSQGLVAKLDNAETKTALLANYVQTNLTYKAIEFGRRARIPNKPADIIQNKYGDCKDHAVLLQQMLVAVGVPAQLALVSHRGSIQKDQPSLDQFDHMIVYVPAAGGGHFLDCTSKGADVANTIPVGLDGQAALILDSHDPRFVTIPKYPENASSISVEQHLHLVGQTDLAVEESLTIAGVYSTYMRDYLLQIPEASHRTMLQNQMGMGDADLTDLKIDSLSNPGEPLHLLFSYSLKKQFRLSDNQIRGVLRAGFARSYLMASPADSRLTPFVIHVPFSIDFSEFVDVPAGFKAVQPEHLDLKLDPRFATGQGSALVKSNTLNLNFKCRLMTGKFEASDYSAYRQTMSQALSFIEREVVFKADVH